MTKHEHQLDYIDHVHYRLSVHHASKKPVRIQFKLIHVLYRPSHLIIL